MEIKIEMERRRRQKEGIYEQSIGMEKKSLLFKEIEDIGNENPDESFDEELLDSTPILDLDFDDDEEDLFEPTSIEKNSFSICPYCGRKLILEKTPEFCPFCDEILII